MRVEHTELEEKQSRPSLKSAILFRSLFAILCTVGITSDSSCQNVIDKLSNKDKTDAIEPSIEKMFKGINIVPDSTPINKKRNDKVIIIPDDAMLS